MAGGVGGELREFDVLVVDNNRHPLLGRGASPRKQTDFRLRRHVAASSPVALGASFPGLEAVLVRQPDLQAERQAEDGVVAATLTRKNSERQQLLPLSLLL